MNRLAAEPSADQAQAQPAIQALRALYGPSPAETIAALPAVLEGISAATIEAQADPSARTIERLRHCLIGAERQLGRIAAAMEARG